MIPMVILITLILETLWLEKEEKSVWTIFPKSK